MTAWSSGAQHAEVIAGLAQCSIFSFNPQSVIENELVPRLDLRAFCPTGGRDIASPCPSPTPIASFSILWSGQRRNQAADGPSEDVSDSAEDMDGCEDPDALVLIPGS
jgi:hypothetical protein